MPLRKYWQAFTAFHQGARTIEVARLIGCNYKTAWRLRQVVMQEATKIALRGHNR